MWSIKATVSRSTGRAATGHRSRSMTAGATWLATPAGLCRSVRAIRTDRSGSHASILTPGGAQASPGFVCGQTSIAAVLLLHMLEHGRGRPAIDLQAIGLLIGAERRAREHAGLAVDLVLVEPGAGERLLHYFDIAGLELRVLAPGRLEAARIADALAQMADEQHIEIGEVIVLDHVVVLEREEGRAVAAFREQQRGWRAHLGERRPAPMRRHIAAHEPLAHRLRHFRHADRAIDVARRAHLVGPAQPALPTLADELRGR